MFRFYSDTIHYFYNGLHTFRSNGCDIMKQPKHYTTNGLSPVDCFKQGLVSKEEYIGFCKCNIIKYLCRAEYKENAKEDYEKAQHYIQLLLEIIE